MKSPWSEALDPPWGHAASEAKIDERRKALEPSLTIGSCRHGEVTKRAKKGTAGFMGFKLNYRKTIGKWWFNGI